jgi:site-specific recombinase XerD
MSDSDEALDFEWLLASWKRHLESQRRSEHTIRAYTASVRAWLTWCDDAWEDPDLSRRQIDSWTSSMPGSPATVRLRQISVRRFTAWLAEEGETETDELAGMKPPKLDKRIIRKLNAGEVDKLLAACKGRGLLDRRDEAIIRLALDTGARAEELVHMEVTDIDHVKFEATIRRGKGAKGRRVPFSPHTGRVIERYLRQRAKRFRVPRPALWVGAHGGTLAYPGMRAALMRRAEVAGIPNFHLHRLRHTMASRFLDAGGQEGELMSIGGWASRSMIDLYTADTAADRALSQAHGRWKDDDL